MSPAFVLWHAPTLDVPPRMAMLMIIMQSSIIAYAVPLVKRPIYSGIIGGMYGVVGLHPLCLSIA